MWLTSQKSKTVYNDIFFNFMQKAQFRQKMSLTTFLHSVHDFFSFESFIHVGLYCNIVVLNLFTVPFCSILLQALGNHEFDLTPDGLAPYLKDVDFDVISCNIDASKEPVIDGLFEKSVVKTVGGELIGVVGYTHSRTHELSQSRKLFEMFIKDRWYR